jgi:hypothetical protein
MSPSDFEKLIEGLSSDEIISAAIQCGYLENRDISPGDVAEIPYWLAQILSKQGIIEIVEAQA